MSHVLLDPVALLHDRIGADVDLGRKVSVGLRAPNLLRALLYAVLLDELHAATAAGSRQHEQGEGHTRKKRAGEKAVQQGGSRGGSWSGSSSSIGNSRKAVKEEEEEERTGTCAPHPHASRHA